MTQLNNVKEKFTEINYERDLKTEDRRAFHG